MLRNNNRKFISELSRNCLKANKIRNMIAIFAIVLTTVLFTSVMTVLEGTGQSIKEQQIRQVGTDFMLSMKYLTEEASGNLEKNPEFSRVGKMQYLGTVQNERLRGVAASISWADQTFLDGMFVKLEKGSLPEKEDEILADTVVLDLLGIPEKIGQTVTLSYEVNGESRERDMILSGILEGNKNETDAVIYCSRIFIERELEGVPIPPNGTVGAGNLMLYGSFPSEKNLEEKRSTVLKAAGFNPEAKPGEEGYVASNINPAYNNTASIGGMVIVGAVAMVMIILLAGYLIISNIFRISVLKDMRMYGQLKTIGTSPRQLKTLLRKQANILNLIGIPIGLFLGYLLGILLLPIVMNVTVYQDVEKIRPNVWAFAAAAVFSYLTVWISCRRPAELMSKISPIQALRYQGSQESRRKQVKGKESRYRIFQMALSNIRDNRGRTMLVVLSLSLSVILLNSVLNFVASFDEETYVEGICAADFVVSNLSYGSIDESEEYTIPQDFLEEAGQRTDLEKNGAVYCYQAPAEDAESSGNDYDGVTTTKILTVNQEPYPEEYAQEKGKMLYGFDPEVFKRCKVVEGTLDMEKLAVGNYIVEATTFVNNHTDYDENCLTLRPGDKVKGEIGGVTLEYEVLATVVVQSGLLGYSSAGENACLILPSQEYLNRFPGKMPIHYVMDAQEGKYDQVDAFLNSYEERPQADISYKSSSDVIEEFHGLEGTFTSTGTILAVLFGVIGVLNLLNVTLTNAIARQREFAIMQSIGMTRKQLRKLFVMEGLLYAVIAGILSLILSGVLSLTAVRAVTGAYWFSVYHFTILPACLLIPLYLAAAGLIALVIDRLWNNGSVVERLRGSK